MILSGSTWLNFHHLYYFKVIAQEGSIAKASVQLRLGQPTLSAQLKQFEDMLGVALFERHHRKLTLTEHGRIALEYAHEIFKLGSEMIEVINDRPQNTQVPIQVGALDGIPKHVILELVKSAKQVASAKVSILENSDDFLMRELLAHRIDLFLTNRMPGSEFADQVNVKRISKLKVQVYGSKDFKGLKKNFPNSMNEQPLIVPTVHSQLRIDLEHYFKTLNIHPMIVGEMQDTSVQKLMSIEGIGMFIAPEIAVEQHLKWGQLVEIGEVQGVYEDIYLISAVRKIENPIAKAVFKNFKL